MRIGIVTEYRHNESSLVALDIANYLLASGTSPRIFATTSNGVSLHRYWDTKVTHERRAGEFRSWCQQCDLLIWTHLPDEYLLDLLELRGTTSIAAISWGSFSVDNKDALDNMEHIVVPCIQTANLLSDVYHIAPEITSPETIIHDPPYSQVVMCPWSLTGMTVKPSRDPITQIRVFVYLDAYETEELTHIFINDLDRLTKVRKDISISIGLPGLTPFVRRLLVGKPHFFVYVGPQHDRLLELLLDHDILLYPARRSGFGRPVLAAQSVGIPSICYKCPPFGNVAAIEEGGFCIDCLNVLDDRGQPYVYNYSPITLVSALDSVTKETSWRSRLNDTTVNALARRQAFELVWGALLRNHG